MTNPLRLTMTLSSAGRWDALRDGRVKPQRVDPVITVNEGAQSYRSFVRDLPFDVADIPAPVYLNAKSLGIPITAIPVFTFSLNLPLGAIRYNVDSGIKEPKDLEGRRVGLRSLESTSSALTRQMLREEVGLDTQLIQWIATEEFMLAQYKAPSNVGFIPTSVSLEQMLEAKYFDAVIHSPVKAETGDLRTLLSSEEMTQLAVNYYRRTGVYPISHIIAIKEAVVGNDPWVIESLFHAFNRSIDLYLEGLDKTESLDDLDRTFLYNRQTVGADAFFPRGLSRNTRNFEALIAACADQGIIPESIDVDSLFPAGSGALE